MVSEELVWLSGWGWEGQAVKEDRILGRTPSTTGGGGGRESWGDAKMEGFPGVSNLNP